MFTDLKVAVTRRFEAESENNVETDLYESDQAYSAFDFRMLINSKMTTPQKPERTG